MSTETGTTPPEEVAPLTNLFPTTNLEKGPTDKKVRLKNIPDYLPGPAPTPDLISSMKGMGQLQQVGLVGQRDGSYAVAFGRRRIKAARLLGWTEINAVIFPEGFANIATLALQENSTRRENPTSEFHAIVQLIRERHGIKDISSALGIPVKQIEKRLVLRKLPESLLIALDKAQIPYSVADTVARMKEEHQGLAVKYFETEGKLPTKIVTQIKESEMRAAEKEAQAGLFSQEEQDTQTLTRLREALSKGLEVVQGARAGLFVYEVTQRIEEALAAIMIKPEDDTLPMPPSEDEPSRECDICHGTGKDPFEDSLPCDTCGGSGKAAA